MITFFAIPKPFVGHTGIIQRNAILSWNKILGNEIILFGNENGVEEIGREIEARTFPNISLSPHGTPYLDEVFKIAQSVATNKYLCYVNADIILFPELIDTIKRIAFPQFLLTGQRWDVDINSLVEPDGAFREYAEGNHTLQPFPGMDYFVFPKGMIKEFPRFIVGRRGWDNWLIYQCRSREIPVIDATGEIVAVHQNHDYNHIPEKKGNRWENCPESDYNLSLVKNRIIYLWELNDATHHFLNGKLVGKSRSLRATTQGLILTTPEYLHGIINPFYRAGHIVKWGIKTVRK